MSLRLWWLICCRCAAAGRPALRIQRHFPPPPPRPSRERPSPLPDRPPKPSRSARVGRARPSGLGEGGGNARREGCLGRRSGPRDLAFQISAPSPAPPRPTLPQPNQDRPERENCRPEEKKKCRGLKFQVKKTFQPAAARSTTRPPTGRLTGTIQGRVEVALEQEPPALASGRAAPLRRRPAPPPGAGPAAGNPSTRSSSTHRRRGGGAVPGALRARRSPCSCGGWRS